MADITIGAELINKIADALENTAKGLGDVDKNTENTANALTALNNNFAKLFGKRGDLSKLLLKDNRFSRDSETHLKNIHTKLGGLQTLIDINQKQLDELKKLTPAGLSGADKPRGGGKPASDLTRAELEKLLKKGVGGGASSLLNPRNVLLGGAASAMGIPQMAYRAVAAAGSMLIPYLLLRMGRSYAEGGLGQIGLPQLGGVKWREGSGALGALGRAAAGTGLTTLGGAYLLRTGIKSRMGMTAAGRTFFKGTAMASGFGAGAMGRTATGAFGSIGRTGQVLRPVLASASAIRLTGTRITSIGTLTFKNGRVTGLTTAAGKTILRSNKKAFMRALGKGGARIMARSGAAVGVKAIPVIGWLIGAGLTASDAYQLMSEGGDEIAAAWKEEWEVAGYAGRAMLVLGNPSSAVLAAQDKWQAWRWGERTMGGAAGTSRFGWNLGFGDNQDASHEVVKAQAERDKLYMNPSAKTKKTQRYKEYQTERMSLIERIQDLDDGLWYPYGFNNFFAPLSYKVPGRRRKMTVDELIGCSVSELRVIRGTLQQVSTIRFYDKGTGMTQTWKERETWREQQTTAREIKQSRESMTYVSRTPANASRNNTVKGARLAKMWELGIIGPRNLRYMTSTNRALLQKHGNFAPGEVAEIQQQIRGKLVQEEDVLMERDPIAGQKTIFGRYEDTQDDINRMMNAQYTNLNEFFKRTEIRDKQASVAHNDAVVTMRNAADATNALTAALTENQDETEFNAGGPTGGSSTGGFTPEQLEAAQGRGL